MKETDLLLHSLGQPVKVEWVPAAKHYANAGIETQQIIQKLLARHSGHCHVGQHKRVFFRIRGKRFQSILSTGGYFDLVPYAAQVLLKEVQKGRLVVYGENPTEASHRHPTTTIAAAHRD